MKRFCVLILLAMSSLLAMPSLVMADVKLPALFSDNMVVQRNMAIPVWGWATPGEAITVTLGEHKAVATAGADGRWTARLDPLPAGGPLVMTIAGNNTLTINNVMVGEVWICSGQSNMEWVLQNVNNAAQEIAACENPQIRMFTVTKVIAMEPRDDCQGKWQTSTPTNVSRFSAVGYFFARDLQKALDVPVGMIHTSWGGTIAEAWAEETSLLADDELKRHVETRRKAIEDYANAVFAQRAGMEQWYAAVEKAKAEGQAMPLPPMMPGGDPRGDNRMASSLYNGMVAPLLPYAIAGAIWYQGESNVGRTAQYRTLFPTMITGWRQAWGQGDFPFLFVQLANFMAVKPAPGESGWAELREAQLMTLALPKTGMTVTIDIGEANDIHPRNKQDVGARLALAAQHVAYDRKLVFSGPIFDRMVIEGNKARIHFTQIGGGLDAKGGQPLQGFAICGEDKKFNWADAVIDGETVVVSSDKVAMPVAVRYAWADNPICNLANKEGLPASPFRTDGPGDK